MGCAMGPLLARPSLPMKRKGDPDRAMVAEAWIIGALIALGYLSAAFALFG